MKSKALCVGCEDDYYNHNQEGGCWGYDKATVVTRMKVGIWQNPPYKWIPRETLSCHNPKGGIFIKEDDPRIMSNRI